MLFITIIIFLTKFVVLFDIAAAIGSLIFADFGLLDYTACYLIVQT